MGPGFSISDLQVQETSHDVRSTFLNLLDVKPLFVPAFAAGLSVYPLSLCVCGSPCLTNLTLHLHPSVLLTYFLLEMPMLLSIVVKSVQC